MNSISGETILQKRSGKWRHTQTKENHGNLSSAQLPLKIANKIKEIIKGEIWDHHKKKKRPKIQTHKLSFFLSVFKIISDDLKKIIPLSNTQANNI